jgi:ABC-type nitrate/sulfonate/bicarbonate transport system permease component
MSTTVVRGTRRVPRWLTSVVVSMVLLVVWELLARLWLARLGVLAPPSGIVAELVRRPDLYLSNTLATGWIALRGWFWGDLAAIVAAVLFVQLRVLERLFLRLALVVYCLPLVAVMPLLQLTFDPDTAKVVLSGLAVFFTTLVGTMLGLRSAAAGPLTLVRAWGGGRGAALRFVRLPSGLPAILTGLQIGAAAATLGAVFAEFIGSEQGLGVLLINGLQMLRQDQVYAVAVLATAMAGIPYLLLGLVRRIVAPWSTAIADVPPAEPAARGSKPARAAAAIGWVLLSVAIVVIAWEAYLVAFQVSPFVGKNPIAVIGYLFSGPDAAAHRAALIAGLGVTLLHAGVGYAAGLAIGVLAAVAFATFPVVQIVLGPPAIALRSVPIIALIPILLLVFGRGLPGVVAITAIVTFFPTLAQTQLGLSRVPRDALALMHSYDASIPAMLWRLRLPAALPSIFASARVAAPTAVLGATLAEWLATGDGLGHLIVVSRSFSDYNQLWAAAMLLAIVSVLFYSLVSGAERLALRRFAATDG